VKKFIAQYPLLLINKRFFKIAFLFFVLMFFLALQLNRWHRPLRRTLVLLNQSHQQKFIIVTKIYLL